MIYTTSENKDGKYTDGTTRYDVLRCIPAADTITVEADSVEQAATMLGLTLFVEPEPEAKPITVPKSITPAQARVWLISAGISLDSVGAMLDAIPDATQRAIAKAKWEYGLIVLRNDPIVEALGQQLGLSSSLLDDAFVAASKIQ
jgi:hypothetical protein